MRGERAGRRPFARRLPSKSLTTHAVEHAVLSLVNQSLAVEWGLTATQRGLLGSAIFVGFLVRRTAE